MSESAGAPDTDGVQGVGRFVHGLRDARAVQHEQRDPQLAGAGTGGIAVPRE
ncbi:hypothetical protein [Streptomyces sp. JNUCC 63]